MSSSLDDFTPFALNILAAVSIYSGSQRIHLPWPVGQNVISAHWGGDAKALTQPVMPDLEAPAPHRPEASHI